MTAGGARRGGRCRSKACSDRSGSSTRRRDPIPYRAGAPGDAAQVGVARACRAGLRPSRPSTVAERPRRRGKRRKEAEARAPARKHIRRMSTTQAVAATNSARAAVRRRDPTHGPARPATATGRVTRTNCAPGPQGQAASAASATRPCADAAQRPADGTAPFGERRPHPKDVRAARERDEPIRGRFSGSRRARKAARAVSGDVDPVRRRPRRNTKRAEFTKGETAQPLRRGLCAATRRLSCGSS